MNVEEWDIYDDIAIEKNIIIRRFDDGMFYIVDLNRKTIKLSRAFETAELAARFVITEWSMVPA